MSKLIPMLDSLFDQLRKNELELSSEEMVTFYKDQSDKKWNKPTTVGMSALLILYADHKKRHKNEDWKFFNEYDV